MLCGRCASISASDAELLTFIEIGPVHDLAQFTYKAIIARNWQIAAYSVLFIGIWCRSRAMSPASGVTGSYDFLPVRVFMSNYMLSLPIETLGAQYFLNECWKYGMCPDVIECDTTTGGNVEPEVLPEILTIRPK